MPKKLTREHYEQLALERGFEWLGVGEPNSVAEKTIWRCAEGHSWKSTYRSIKYNGSGCPYCAGLARKVAADYAALARLFGFEWLGPTVHTVKAKTTWCCSQNHTWQATYSSISQGFGCPHCAGLAPKTEDDYIDLAQQRGFVWLGPMVSGVNIKTNWQCSQGHVWQTAYSWIQQGTGCPTCAGVKPKTEGDYKALAKHRGFEWLGPMVKNVQSKTQWRCHGEHIWSATFSSIQQGSGCPKCRWIKVE